KKHPWNAVNLHLVFNIGNIFSKQSFLCQIHCLTADPVLLWIKALIYDFCHKMNLIIGKGRIIKLCQVCKLIPIHRLKLLIAELIKVGNFLCCHLNGHGVGVTDLASINLSEVMAIQGIIPASIRGLMDFQIVISNLIGSFYLLTILRIFLLLWSSIFVTPVAKKYRFMQFELDRVFDTR